MSQRCGKPTDRVNTTLPMRNWPQRCILIQERVNSKTSNDKYPQRRTHPASNDKLSQHCTKLRDRENSKPPHISCHSIVLSLETEQQTSTYKLSQHCTKPTDRVKGKHPQLGFHSIVLNQETEGTANLHR